jgi:thiamine biosynthesis lipoprotein
LEEHHHSFRAMNTRIDLFVMAERRPSDAFLSGELLFEQQEQRFSRFRETSLLSRFNRGEPIQDPWFATAMRLAFEMHDETGGIFNPAVLPSLVAAGYDRTFEEVKGGAPYPSPAPPLVESVRRDGDRCQLLGGAIDLGGIVKGWTVDLAVELLARDHPDVLVNAGGDMRAAGSDGAGTGWLVEVEPPRGLAGWSGRITDALATSTTTKRRWTTDAGSTAHHLIDPRTGLPAESAFVQVSVRASTCARAECWAKAILIGGEPALERATELGLGTAAWSSSGQVLAGFEAR